MNLMEHYGLIDKGPKFLYQLLDRMRSDCAYYLNNGNRYRRVLWTGDEAEQVQIMREIHAALPEPPEWLTMEQIEKYAEEMGVK